MFRRYITIIIMYAVATWISLCHADITFNISDADTGECLEFAAITLKTTSGEYFAGGVTDASGRFTASLKPGKWDMTISLVGYTPLQRIITVTDPTAVLEVSISPDEPLGEVVVTARESRNSTSASLIDTTAMKHLQPSSFTDLIELLPGGTSKDPSMGEVNAIALRQASNITPTDDYATVSLGTSFVIDGVPVNTGSQMVTTPDADRTGRIAVGKGVDMRSISTDDIEKVEIVRGIPSVEYGELTSGLVNIKRKSGVSRLEARFKADTQSQLFYLGKGFGITDRWILNTGIDYLDSKIDPRNNRESFKRVTASIRSDARWNNTVMMLTWNSALSYSGTFERDHNDPDLTVNNTIDFYNNDIHSLRWNNTLNFRPVVQRFFRDLSITTGLSYADEHLSQQKHVAASRLMPLPVSISPGSNYVGYLPMLYLADYDVYGKPFTAFAKAAASFRATSSYLTSLLKAGIEWNMSKNYGDGAVYDLTRPLTAGNNTRPRSYSDIPAMQQLSAYVEEQLTFHAGMHTLNLTAGLRETQLLNLDKRYILQAKPYLDPRFNANWVFTPAFIRGEALRVELAGGFGWHTKMPVAAYLYPDKVYTDLEQLNYYHSNPDYRTMNVMTFIDDVTNYDLRAARNFKWEVRGDLEYRGNRLSVTFFRENMTDGFRHSSSVFRYNYRRYDASSFDPTIADRAPVVEELPFTPVTYQATRSTVTNGSRTLKDGIEYTLQSRRIPSLKTRVTINGAYFRTVNNNSQDLWYRPNVVVNNHELQYVGLYDDEDGSIYRSFNTNVMFDTDIPRLALNVSLSIQNMWFTSRQTLWRDGVPTHYLDPDGVIHEYTEADKTDPYLSQLLRRYNESSFDELKVPVSTSFNLKATKSFWKDRIGIALYVNRLLTIEPDYERYGVTIRRYSSPYFGMELNLKI
ncbi:MAG: TonB-dependent receptor plug domain-containing protein [Lachnoclostridium sp.]|nr:TonB-dependent receptor plug domain-containing protein [Lachnoclostridium sp.]